MDNVIYIDGPLYCAICGAHPARRYEYGIRCNVCDDIEFCAKHPVPLPNDISMLQSLSDIGMIEATVKLSHMSTDSIITSYEFIGNAIKELLENDVSVKFNKRIYNSKNSYNYFSYLHKKELEINYFDSDFNNWFPIFLHEYCHFLQWRDEFKKWNSYTKYLIKYDSVFNTNLTKIKPNIIRKVQEIEMDCDQKAIAFIKKYKLDIDLKQYIKESNFYILCYEFFPKYNKFFVPYEKHILEMFPDTHFTMSDLLNFKHKKEVEKMYVAEFEKLRYNATKL